MRGKVRDLGIHGEREEDLSKSNDEKDRDEGGISIQKKDCSGAEYLSTDGRKCFTGQSFPIISEANSGIK